MLLPELMILSLLPEKRLAKKVPMKMIQDWLGHSDIQTTSNIYSHLDAQSKQESADVIAAALES